MPNNIIYSNASRFVARASDRAPYVVCEWTGPNAWRVVDVTRVEGVAKRWAGASV